MPVAWDKAAKAIIESEKAKRGWSNRDLAKALAQIGVETKEHGIAQKLSNGNFAVSFLLQCLMAMNVENLQIGELLRLHEK